MERDIHLTLECFIIICCGNITISLLLPVFVNMIVKKRFQIRVNEQFVWAARTRPKLDTKHVRTRTAEMIVQLRPEHNLTLLGQEEKSELTIFRQDQNVTWFCWHNIEYLSWPCSDKTKCDLILLTQYWIFELTLFGQDQNVTWNRSDK